jgi:hypothetical protein
MTDQVANALDGIAMATASRSRIRRIILSTQM